MYYVSDNNISHTIFPDYVTESKSSLQSVANKGLDLYVYLQFVTVVLK